ncbi:MAG TPA: DUF4214 domain-containing protein [Pyrinomonadaceae bacterium]|nr:DUF4214 domain-containing protein [Pyrinomonadaceae bacterium]
MTSRLSKFPTFLLTLALGLVCSSAAFGNANIIVQNTDSPGVGFNDSTPTTPVGGNTGTTLGQQRLNAFQYAANLWGASINSGPSITVRASWEPLTCESNSAVLGYAGALGVWRNFSGAPHLNTWYSSALANALSGSDLDPNTAEIVAKFNINLGTSGCLATKQWYLGLDTNHGTNINLVTVLLHEFSHGLGFQTFSNTSTGEEIGGFPSVYDRFLFDNTNGKTWAQMDNSERAASATNTNNLVWNGPRVNADAPAVLTAGRDAQGRPLMFTPNPIQSGSSVSHWDRSGTPNQLMEPIISGNLTHNLAPPQDLTTSLFRDLGWSIAVPAPTPVPTPTPTPVPTPVPASVQLSLQNYSVSEAGGSALVTITRTDTLNAASVNYATSDNMGLNECAVANGNASSRCDYATSLGTLHFAVGEATKAIAIPVVDDAYAEGNENFQITLTSAVGMSLGQLTTANIAIQDNETVKGENPIENTDFFVRQNYIDFLGREPDPGGLAGWRNVLVNCGITIALPCDKIEVSAGFFRSAEFQQRGYFVYRFYSAVGRISLYHEFMPDFAKVSGFLTDQELEANKMAFVDEFMARPEFQNRYAATFNNPTAYVDSLLQTLGLPNHSGRGIWISGLTNQTRSRAQVLREMVESGEVYNKYYNEAFVIMQYFGYLRRSADASYLSWIQTMNQSNGDYRVMINGFMNSDEYRKRFGP